MMKPRMFNGLIYGKTVRETLILSPKLGGFLQIFPSINSGVYHKANILKTEYNIHQHTSYTQIRFRWKIVRNQRSRRNTFPDKYLYNGT